MGTRTSHKPGTFSWADLSTTDLDGAKAFYAGLFGWQTEDFPVPDDGVYVMCNLDGHAAAAMSGMPPGQEGVPPHWNNYVTVESADDTARKATEAGGALFGEAFDVMDQGRMAIISDPQGAVTSVWEPRSHIGAGIVNVHGALTWNELATSNDEEARRFYGDVFGWTFDVRPMGDGNDYSVIMNGDRTNGGIRPLMGPEVEHEVPPYWVPYFAVEDVEATLQRAGELGGRTVVPPMDAPWGRFAGVADPQGAMFSIFAGDLDD